MTESVKKKPYRMRNMLIVVAVVALVVILLLALKGPSSSQTVSTWQPINLNPENLPAYLSEYGAVKSLPESASVNLEIGNSDYAIGKADVKKGLASDADVSVKLPEKYFAIIGEKGWCAGLKMANKNGDLEVELHDSETALAWKYRSMLKYKSCFA